MNARDTAQKRLLCGHGSAVRLQRQWQYRSVASSLCRASMPAAPTHRLATFLVKLGIIIFYLIIFTDARVEELVFVKHVTTDGLQML